MAFPTWRSWFVSAELLGIECERGLQTVDFAAVIQGAIFGNDVTLDRG